MTAIEVVMPRLSDSMEEGTVLQWLKSVGDTVAIGDDLVEIETDKATMVYEADTAGVLTEMTARDGETLPVGSVIARISSGEDETPRAAPTADAVPSPDAQTPPPASVPEAVASDGAAYAPDHAHTRPANATTAGNASPVARRLARQLGVDLTEIAGTGPRGRIVKADIEQAHSRAPAPAAPTAPEPTLRGAVNVAQLGTLQRTVARRMAESTQTAPQFVLEIEVDMTRCLKFRSRLAALAGEREARPTINDLVVKACAIALAEFPRVNSAYVKDAVEEYARINVGVAVAAEGALLVPTVFDADRKTIRQIAAEARKLIDRARHSKITPPELSGGTFTVSNLGMYGITSFAAIINPPQAAILAVGAITRRPAVRNDAMVAADCAVLTLTGDHRVLYGADGASFLSRVRDLLEEPLQLVT